MTEIKITDKAGVTLKTAGKYCSEDIGVTIDESLLGGSGGSGGIIEVDELPTENIDENAIYVSKKPSEIILSYGDGSPMTFTEMGMPNSIYVCETKPTSDILISNSAEFNIYYVTSENDLYAYGDWEENGTLFWARIGDVMGGLSYLGKVLSLEEATEMGLYLLVSDAYYKYSNEWLELLTPKGTLDLWRKGTVNVTPYAYVKTYYPKLPTPDATLVYDSSRNSFNLTINNIFNTQEWGIHYVLHTEQGYLYNSSLTINGITTHELFPPTDATTLKLWFDGEASNVEHFFRNSDVVTFELKRE